MLEIDSDKRMTAEQALAHPYLAQYADPTDEPSSLPYDQTFEDFELPVEKWKGMCKDYDYNFLLERARSASYCVKWQYLAAYVFMARDLASTGSAGSADPADILKL